MIFYSINNTVSKKIQKNTENLEKNEQKEVNNDKN